MFVINWFIKKRQNNVPWDNTGQERGIGFLAQTECWLKWQKNFIDWLANVEIWLKKTIYWLVHGDIPFVQGIREFFRELLAFACSPHNWRRHKLFTMLPFFFVVAMTSQTTISGRTNAMLVKQSRLNTKSIIVCNQNCIFGLVPRRNFIQWKKILGWDTTHTGPKINCVLASVVQKSKLNIKH